MTWTNTVVLDSEKWYDFGHILMVASIAFVDGLDLLVCCEKNKESVKTTSVLVTGLLNC